MQQRRRFRQSCGRATTGPTARRRGSPVETSGRIGSSGTASSLRRRTCTTAVEPLRPRVERLCCNELRRIAARPQELNRARHYFYELDARGRCFRRELHKLGGPHGSMVRILTSAVARSPRGRPLLHKSAPLLAAALWAREECPRHSGDTLRKRSAACPTSPDFTAFHPPATTASFATLPSSTISSATCNATQPGYTPSSFPGSRAACPNPIPEPRGPHPTLSLSPSPSLKFGLALTRYRAACTSTTSRAAPTRRLCSTTYAMGSSVTSAQVLCPGGQEVFSFTPCSPCLHTVSSHRVFTRCLHTVSSHSVFTRCLHTVSSHRAPHCLASTGQTTGQTTG